MLNAGLVGFGYWGPNIARNVNACGQFNLLAISDTDSSRQNVAGRAYPGATICGDANDIFSDPRIDAVFIATPVRSHFELGMAALKAGKHVLLAKPMTETAAQSESLINEAAKRNLILCVDHTFLFSGAVRKLKEIVSTGELGDIYYYDSVRINLGLFQPDVNAIWDLAVHDLSILNYVLPERPIAVSATGISHVQGNPENMAFLTLFFEGNTVAHINVNWLAPVKVRHTLIGGAKKMIVYNDLEPTEKVKVYDTGVTVGDDKDQIRKVVQDYRTGDMWAPQIDRTEPLNVEMIEFAEAIKNGQSTVADGSEGLSVVRTLEAATKSMHERGTAVPI